MHDAWFEAPDFQGSGSNFPKKEIATLPPNDMNGQGVALNRNDKTEVKQHFVYSEITP